MDKIQYMYMLYCSGHMLYFGQSRRILMIGSLAGRPVLAIAGATPDHTRSVRRRDAVQVQVLASAS